jgi:hypothetical protein
MRAVELRRSGIIQIALVTLVISSLVLFGGLSFGLLQGSPISRALA